MIFKSKNELENIFKKNINGYKTYENIRKVFSLVENFNNINKLLENKYQTYKEKLSNFNISFEKETLLYKISWENILKNNKDFFTKVSDNIEKNNNIKSIEKNNLNNLKKDMTKNYSINIKKDKENLDNIIKNLSNNKETFIKNIFLKQPDYIIEKNININIENEKKKEIDLKFSNKKNEILELKNSNSNQINIFKNNIEQNYENKKNLIKNNHRLLIDIYNPIVLKLDSERKESIRVFDDIINKRIFDTQQLIKAIEEENKDNILFLNIKKNKEINKLESQLQKQKDKYTKKEKDVNDKYILDQKILDEKIKNLHNDIKREKIDIKYKKIRKMKEKSLEVIRLDIEKENSYYENKLVLIEKKYNKDLDKNKLAFQNKKDELLKRLKFLNDKKSNSVETIKKIYDLKKFNIYNQFILHSNYDDKNIAFNLNKKSLELSINEHTIKKNDLNFNIENLKLNLNYNIENLKIENRIKKIVLETQEKILLDKMFINEYSNKFDVFNENHIHTSDKFKINEKNKLYNNIDKLDANYYIKIENIEKENFINNLNILKKHNDTVYEGYKFYLNNFFFNEKSLIEKRKSFYIYNTNFFLEIINLYKKNINENIKTSLNAYNLLTKYKNNINDGTIFNYIDLCISDLNNELDKNINHDTIIFNILTNYLNTCNNLFHKDIFDLNNKIKNHIFKSINDFKDFLLSLYKNINIKYNEYNNYKNRKLSIKAKNSNGDNLIVYNLKSVLSKEINIIDKKINNYETILYHFNIIIKEIQFLEKYILKIEQNLNNIIDNYLEIIIEKNEKNLKNKFLNLFNELKIVYKNKYNILKNKENEKILNKNIKNEKVIIKDILNLLNNNKLEMIKNTNIFIDNFSKIINKEKKYITEKNLYINSLISNVNHNSLNNFKIFKTLYKNFTDYKILKFNERKNKKIKDIDLKINKNVIYLTNFDKILGKKKALINKNFSDVIIFNQNQLQNSIKVALNSYNKDINNIKNKIISIDEYYSEIEDAINNSNLDLIKETNKDLKLARKSIKNNYLKLKKLLITNNNIF